MEKFYGVPPLLIRGFVSAYKLATPGLSPMHTIYGFIIYSQICAKFVLRKEQKITIKRRSGPFLNNKIIKLLQLFFT